MHVLALRLDINGMNDHNILQCAIHMVHGWSLPPNTGKRERKIAHIISWRIKRDDIYEKLAVHAADNVTDALHEMPPDISFDRIAQLVTLHIFTPKKMFCKNSLTFMTLC